jgi:hypothetical protein
MTAGKRVLASSVAKRAARGFILPRITDREINHN